MAQAAAMTLEPAVGASSAGPSAEGSRPPEASACGPKPSAEGSGVRVGPQAGPLPDGSLRSAMSEGALRLRVTDVSGQKSARASAVPLSSTIRELVQEFLAKMGLARIDADGRPLQYYARLEREGRHLNGSELVGDALENDDELTLTPNIEAGGR